MEVKLNISIEGLKGLVLHNLNTGGKCFAEVYYTDTEYLMLSVRDNKIFITVVYQNDILTHMSDVMYATFLDIVGELNYSNDNFKNIISHYI